MLENAVIHEPVIEKVANLELSKDISEWNKEIMEQFYNDIPELPKESFVDIVIKSVDENKGYAKGSVIVKSDKQINFPVIINDYELSPFDIFVQDGEFRSATKRNIDNALAPYKLGVPSKPKSLSKDDVKSPGNIQPKESVQVNEQTQGDLYKMSSIINVKESDIEIDMTDNSVLEELVSPTACEIRLKYRPAIDTPDSIVVKQKTIAGVYLGDTFISADGKYYTNSNPLYGIRGGGTDIVTNNRLLNNKYDGSDKQFEPMKELNQGKPRDYSDIKTESLILCVFGNTCKHLRDSFRSVIVNGSRIYVGEKKAIVPSNVLDIQEVSEIKSPEYKMALTGVDEIYLVPKDTKIIINPTRISYMDVVKPKDKCECDVSVKVASGGFAIDGADDLYKVAGISGPMNVNDTKTALTVLGASKDKAIEIMKVAVNKCGDSVGLYNTNKDYISDDIIGQIEKRATMENMFSEIVRGLNIDLSKEASLLKDPEVVDTVLSLNFINEENLNNYIKDIPNMKKVSSQLAGLIIASRMGLKSIDEGAAKNAMDGLDEVIDGLTSIRMSLKGR